MEEYPKYEFINEYGTEKNETEKVSKTEKKPKNKKIFIGIFMIFQVIVIAILAGLILRFTVIKNRKSKEGISEEYIYNCMISYYKDTNGYLDFKNFNATSIGPLNSKEYYVDLKDVNDMIEILYTIEIIDEFIFINDMVQYNIAWE